MKGDTVTEAARIAQAATIARQNDQFRAALAFGAPPETAGKALFTPGVDAMGPEFLALLQLTVAGFADFNEDNDPYGVTTRKWRICPTFKNVSGIQVGLTVDVVAFSALRAS